MNYDDPILNDKIARYLNDEMTEDERLQFEKSIAENDELQEFLEINAQINGLNEENSWVRYEGDSETIKEKLRLFNDAEVIKFSDRLSNFRKDKTEFNTTRSISWTKILVAAGIAASLVLGVIFLTPSEKDLAALYDEHSDWQELPSLTTKGASEEDLLAGVERSFRSGEFQQVISQVDALLNTTPEQEANLLLYKGISQLEMNQNEAALTTFSNLQNGNTIDKHKGYWYIALVYLKMRDEAAFREQLEIISQQPSYFRHKEAKKILSEID